VDCSYSEYCAFGYMDLVHLPKYSNSASQDVARNNRTPMFTFLLFEYYHAQYTVLCIQHCKSRENKSKCSILGGL